MERLESESYSDENLSKDRLVSEYIVPTIDNVLDRYRDGGEGDLEQSDFYFAKYEKSHDNLTTIIEFETDAPDDNKNCLSVNMMHQQSDRLIQLPDVEVKNAMNLLGATMRRSDSSGLAARRLMQDLATDSTASLELYRETVVDVGYQIDLSNGEIDKTKVYRTVINDIEVDRISIGVAEDTPIGIGTMRLDADSEDYKAISLACQLIRQQNTKNSL